MLFSKIFRNGRAVDPILPDLDMPVLPLGPDEGTVQVRGPGGLRVRTHLKAGGNAGEGTDNTDRSNVG
jgi:hypothetical protein